MSEKTKDSERILHKLVVLFRTDKLSVVAAVLGALLSFLAFLLKGPEALSELTTLFSKWLEGSPGPPSLILPVVVLMFNAGGAAAATSFDPRPVIEAGIFVTLFIAFFWCLYIALHSSNGEKVKIALDVVKMLFGFLVGAATRYLGG